MNYATKLDSIDQIFILIECIEVVALFT